MQETTKVSLAPPPDGWFARLGAIGDRPEDSAEERLRHRLLIYMGVLMSGGGLIWGGLATYYGRYLPAIIPFGYTASTCVNLVYFARSKSFVRVRFVQVLMSLILPFLFQWVLGGFAASGAVMLWAMLSIVGSLTFTGGRTTVKWLVLYSVLVIASGLVDAYVRARYSPGASDAVQVMFVVINVVTISNIVFGLTLYLIGQRERAERALATANQQIEGLEEVVRSARKLGQYTLESKIGEGGMGEVYRASHAMLRRPTAIKLLPTERVGAESLRRFEQEVQRTAQLSHPNTITVFDYGRTPDGVFYYAMELLGGLTLQSLVTADGPQPIGRVVHVLVQAAEALSEAHGIGLIHRDIKPANLMLCEYGGKLDHLKILDFGLVRSIARGDEAGITRDGSVAGTPAYLAPETFTKPDQVDHRSDLYALGAVGFWMLTGEKLFHGETVAEVCAHHIHTEPDPPSRRRGEAVPADLEELILRCLEKDPEKRPPDAAAFLAALTRCAAFSTWTQEAAGAWWKARGTAIREAPSSGEEDAASRTIDVDLFDRGDPTAATRDIRSKNVIAS